MANISESFAHKMAPKTRWHRSGTKLRQCHPVTDVIPAILRATVQLHAATLSRKQTKPT